MGVQVRTLRRTSIMLAVISIRPEPVARHSLQVRQYADPAHQGALSHACNRWFRRRAVTVVRRRIMPAHLPIRRTAAGHDINAQRGALALPRAELLGLRPGNPDPAANPRRDEATPVQVGRTLGRRRPRPASTPILFVKSDSRGSVVDVARGSSQPGAPRKC